MWALRISSVYNWQLFIYTTFSLASIFNCRWYLLSANTNQQIFANVQDTKLYMITLGKIQLRGLLLYLL